MQLPEKNFWVIIPPQIVSNKDLSLGAKLLFGRIFALTQKDGYCWSSNEYLGEWNGCSPRTIQRYLSELKDGGFIKLYYENSGPAQTEIRKIYVQSFKDPHDKTVTPPRQNCRTPMTDLSHPHDNSVTQYPIDDNNRIYSSKQKKPNLTNSVSYLIRIPSEDIKEFITKYKFTEELIVKEGEKAHDWIVSKGYERKYKNYKMFISNWLRRIKEKQDEEKKPIGSSYKTVDQLKKEGKYW